MPTEAQTSASRLDRTRHLAPTSARRLLGAVLDAAGAGEDAPYTPAEAEEACGRLGWHKVARAWRWVTEAEAREEGSAVAVDEAEGYALAETAARLRPVKTEPIPRSWERALRQSQHRAEECGTCGAVVVDVPSGTVWDVPWRCNTRWCLACLRASLRRTVSRWWALFVADIAEGYTLEMFTVGAWGYAHNAVDTGEYLRRLGRLCRMMRRGVVGCAIPPRSWTAGLRTVECVPKGPGSWYVHAHVIVARRAFYPYGLSLRRLAERYRPDAPLTDAEERAVAVAYGHRAARTLAEEEAAASVRALVELAEPSDLGMRECLRRCGVGEVGRHDILSTAGDADKAAAYLQKVQRYMEKVERDGEGKSSAGGDEVPAGLAWSGRYDIQRALRGRRLVQPFGDLRGALVAPERTELRYQGYGMELRTLGSWDYSDAHSYLTGGRLVDEAPSDLPPGEGTGARRLVDEAEVLRIRRTWYARDVVDTWASWCDVGALVERMDAAPEPIPIRPGDGVLFGRPPPGTDYGPDRPDPAPVEGSDTGSTGPADGSGGGPDRPWWYATQLGIGFSAPV